MTAQLLPAAPQSPLIPRLAIIGLGLIGGSLALALRHAGQVGTVTGCGRNLDNLRQAQHSGMIDAFTTDPAQAAANADVVLLATPLGAMPAMFAAIAPALAAHTVVTDAGSAKASVVAAARAHLPAAALARFVPGHPIAGAEKSGAAAARTDLFQHHRVILTPLAETQPEAVAKIRTMWQAVGAQVLDMALEHHDRVLAATSHLPHVLAYALVDQLAAMQTREEIFRYAAGGFRDFTRIAASDPVMWRDICLANRDAVLAMVDDFQTELTGLRQAIAASDGAAMQALFTRAQHARETFTRNETHSSH